MTRRASSLMWRMPHLSRRCSIIVRASPPAAGEARMSMRRSSGLGLGMRVPWGRVELLVEFLPRMATRGYLFYGQPPMQNSGGDMPIVRDPLNPKISLWNWLAFELRYQRELHGLSLTQVGKLIHVVRSTVSNIEAGRGRIDEDQAKILDTRSGTGHLLQLLLY